MAATSGSSARARARDGRVEQHEAAHRLGALAAVCRIEIIPPIELPTSTAGSPATSSRKRCRTSTLACTRRPPAAGLAAAEAGQVDGQHPRVRAQQRREEVPVEVRAAQAVHQDDRGPSSGPPKST